MNHKRLFRLYREERLMVRRRGGRKRALGTRAPMLVPQWPNDRWSLDFVADQFIDGRRLRILVVVDDCTRECLALVPDTSISGTRVARELDRLIVAYGKPTTIVRLPILQPQRLTLRNSASTNRNSSCSRSRRPSNSARD